MDILAALIRETMAVRDKIEGEKFIQASRQLKRYAASHDLTRSLCLAPKGGVKLTRLSVVFHGGNMVLCTDI